MRSLAHQPVSLDELADVVNLHKKLLEEKKSSEARFEPLRYGGARAVGEGAGGQHDMYRVPPCNAEVGEGGRTRSCGW